MKTKIQLKFLFIAIAAMSVLFPSCKKDIVAIVDEDSDALTAPRSVHENLDIYWNNWSDGQYTNARAAADFGNISQFSSTDEDRSYIIYNNLRIKLIKNSEDAESGVVARIDVADHTRYKLTFDVRVSSDFDWSTKGGKLGFGFLIGDGPEVATAGNGGSFRLVWGVTNGVPSFRPYAYHVDMPDSFGDNFNSRFPATQSLQRNTWYTVELYARSNTGSNHNGSISMKVNGYTVFSDGSFRWTTNDSKRKITEMAMASFRGGGDGSQVSADDFVYFDNLHLEHLDD